VSIYRCESLVLRSLIRSTFSERVHCPMQCNIRTRTNFKEDQATINHDRRILRAWNALSNDPSERPETWSFHARLTALGCWTNHGLRSLHRSRRRPGADTFQSCERCRSGAPRQSGAAASNLLWTGVYVVADVGYARDPRSKRIKRAPPKDRSANRKQKWARRAYFLTLSCSNRPESAWKSW